MTTLHQFAGTARLFFVAGGIVLGAVSGAHAQATMTKPDAMHSGAMKPDPMKTDAMKPADPMKKDAMMPASTKADPMKADSMKPGAMAPNKN